MSNDAVDIIISTYRCGARIDETIASIRHCHHTAFTLWILDQSEDNQTERWVTPHAEQDARIQYRRVPLRGISGTRNAGVKLTSSPYILFTNDDCLVAPGWIDSLLAEFAEQRTWAVFGRVLAGPKRSSTAASDVVLALKLSERRQVYANDRFNLGFGHGHNMAIRRERFLELGGFDEMIGSGSPLGVWDERDLGYRLLTGGGQIVYTPSAVTYHCHWQNWHGALAGFRRYGLGAGAAVAKYMRCGDPAALYLLFEWIFSQGLRQIISGLFKWRRWGKVALGLSQLVYPWIGLARGFTYGADPQRKLYKPVGYHALRRLIARFITPHRQ